ncbi:MAG: muconolactone Delta-isomerase family protein [Janthinobacterium lividum]
MKVIAYDRFKPGVTMETITPLLPEETAYAWRLWKQGIIRENYATADEPGVVIIFEVADAAEARRHLDNFPMTKAGLLEWHCIPVTAPLPLEAMFNAEALGRIAMPDADLEGAKGDH